MKAAVFCNFPERLAVQLREHLVEWGITIVHFGTMTTGTELKDPGVDMVIAFFEVMSHGQSSQAKALAARWNARFVPLTRKVASWVKFLQRPAHPVPAQLEDIPTSVSVSMPVLPEPPIPESSPAPVSREDQQWEEIRDLFADEVEELKKKVTGLEGENHTLKLQLEGSKMSESELYALASDEEKRLKGRISQLEGEIEKKGLELVQLRSSGVDALGGAIRTLVNAGLLNEREAADRLLHVVLGKRA